MEPSYYSESLFDQTLTWVWSNIDSWNYVLSSVHGGAILRLMHIWTKFKQSVTDNNQLKLDFSTTKTEAQTDIRHAEIFQIKHITHLHVDTKTDIWQDTFLGLSSYKFQPGFALKPWPDCGATLRPLWSEAKLAGGLFLFIVQEGSAPYGLRKPRVQISLQTLISARSTQASTPNTQNTPCKMWLKVTKKLKQQCGTSVDHITKATPTLTVIGSN